MPIAFIAVVLGFCYCKELGEKFPEPNMGNIEAETLTLLTSEANPPGKTDIVLRLSSSESFTSKSPLSNRSSRRSASEINTNMKEGKNHRCQHLQQSTRTTLARTKSASEKEKKIKKTTTLSKLLRTFHSSKHYNVDKKQS